MKQGNTTLLIIILVVIALLLGGVWFASSQGLLPQPTVSPSPTVTLEPPTPTTIVLNNELIGKTWIWQDTKMNDGSITKPQKFGDTSMVFNSDGSINVDTDCNMLGGTYTVEQNNVTITLGLSTRMACPESSTESTVVKQLTEVQSFMIEDKNAYFMIKFDSGTMTFVTNPYVGTYKSDDASEATSSGKIISLWLHPDSKAQMNTDYQNEQPAVSETGTWGVGSKATVVVTLDTKNEVPLEEDVILRFTQDENGTLTSEDLTLFKLSGTIVM